MKRYAAAIPLLLITIALAGCQSLSIGEKTAHARESGLHVILYYDQNDSKQPESPYFNALLDEINQSQLKRNQITIHSGDTSNLTTRYAIKHCPAIVVKYNGTEKARVAGNKNVNDILKELNNAIQSKS